MKKFFTYLFASAAFCMIGTVNTMAQDVEEENVTTKMFMNYQDPAKPVEADGVDYHVGEEIGGGAVVIGTGSLFSSIYADLSEYDYLKAETNGVFARIFMNRIGDGQCSAEFSSDTKAIDGSVAWVQERYYTISEDKKVYTVNLAKMVADFGHAHLNGIKFPWNGASDNLCESLVVGKGTSTGVKEVSLKEVLDGQKFNLAGQKVGKNAKGLYIMNGKKYIKK